MSLCVQNSKVFRKSTRHWYNIYVTFSLRWAWTSAIFQVSCCDESRDLFCDENMWPNVCLFRDCIFRCQAVVEQSTGVCKCWSQLSCRLIPYAFRLHLLSGVNDDFISFASPSMSKELNSSVFPVRPFSAVGILVNKAFDTVHRAYY